MAAKLPLRVAPDGDELMSRFARRQPVAHMAEGGDQPGSVASPWSLRGIGQSISNGAAAIAKPFSTPAGYTPALAAPPAPAPTLSAPAAPPPQLGGMNMGVMQMRERAAGLRDGGELHTGHGGVVPGQGTGDKIPAKYEPGEFVVSNDMLDAQPGLREHLRDLRGNVLAAQGTTPAQADAQAVHGGSMHAERGGPNIPGMTADARPFTAADALAFGADAPAGVAGKPSVPGVTMTERPFSPADTRAFGANAPQGAPKPSMLDADIGSAARGGASKVARGVAGVGESLLRGAGRLAAPLALGAQAYQTATTSTDDYAHRMGVEPGDGSLGGMAKDVGIRAVGTLGDIGNNLTFGLAGRTGNMIAGNGFTAGDASNPSAKPPAAAPANTSLPNVQTDAQRGGNPALAPAPAAVDPNALRRVNGGSSPLFTNVADGGMGGNDALMNRGPVSAQSQGAMNGIQGRQDLHDQGMATQAQLARETADAAATNLRGGFGTGAPVAGGLRGQLMTQLAGKKLSANGARVATELEQADATREHNLGALRETARGHDIENRRVDVQDAHNRAQLGMTYQEHQRQQQNWQDTFGAGRADAKNAQGLASQTAWDNHLKNSFQTPGKDGQMMSDPVEAASFTQFASNLMKDPDMAAHYPNGLGDLLKHPEDIAMLHQQYNTKKIQDATYSSGINPKGSSGGTSNDPSKYNFTGQGGNVFQKTLRNAAGEVPVDALKYGANYNRWLPNFGAPNLDLVPPKLRN